MKPIELSQHDIEVIAERLRVHRADKAKCLPPLKDSGAAANSAGNMKDGSSPSARENSRYLDTAAAGRGATADEGSPLSTKPSLLLADPTCQDCDPGYPCATHARRCEGCFAADGLHDGTVSTTKRGPGVTALVELWCNLCDPPVPVGERFADGQPDPWSLDSEELVTTADLPRETPAYWARARDEYDAADDKQDIQPFGRTTK